MVATVPFSLAAFMAAHVRVLSGTHQITLVADSCSPDVAVLLGPSVSFEPIRLSREISIAADLRSLVDLGRLFRRRDFQIVQSITPKAGLLAMVAARLAGVPVRVHWFTGQVWATRSGWRRWFLKTLDRVLAKCSTHLLVDSPSQAAFLASEGVLKPGDAYVLGRGSVCGVDTTRFKPDRSARARIRSAVGIPDEAVVALYLGRLNRDKGLPELAEAFTIAARSCLDLHLLIVGPDEGETRRTMMRVLGDAARRAHFADYTSQPEAHMTASDLFVFPSHREGFGAAVIEAAACEVPAIGTAICGLSDAVAEDESGLLVPLGDVAGLAAAIVQLTTDHRLRHRMGKAARRRVERDFTQAQLTGALQRFYHDLLAPGARRDAPVRNGHVEPAG
jgi:glycosyltransferase involved in cell wall biosynthesis